MTSDNPVFVKNQDYFNDEKSMIDLLEKSKKWFNYLFKYWILILILGFLGGIIGIIYAIYQPKNYIAKTVFVVEDSKANNNLGGLASLAGQFGVDLGSNNGGSILSGDNILLYFKSISLIREVLLSKLDKNAEKLIIDIYAKETGLQKKWSNNPKFRSLKFQEFNPNVKYSREQDSIINSIATTVQKSQLQIGKVDKKASFLEVVITMPDEKLAKLFCDQIVLKAVEKYLNVKMKGQLSTVNNLQNRADSIYNLLNSKTESSIDLQTISSTMDINPLYKKNNLVSSEKTNRDKVLLSTMFAEVVKNLELAKFTLNQGTPVFQVIDQPYYPLLIKQTSKKTSGLIGFLISVSLCVFYLVGLKVIKNN